MTEQLIQGLDRRSFLTHVVPCCSLACLGAGTLSAGVAGLGGEESVDAGVHKFDAEFEQKSTQRRNTRRENRNFISFIKTLQGEVDEKELIRLLNLYSAELGRQVGSRQAQRESDTSFATFTNWFRPPAYANSLTHSIVEDTEKVFELKVTECVWASVFREAGLEGPVGHAAVCNMDFYWPVAFNADFKMERSKTLMQGHDCCNHRYINSA